MLSNEKYMGDALLQKTYTMDFLEKKRVKNEGLVPQYYVENSHEGIIPKDLFMQVQEEMMRRLNMKAGKKRRVYSSKYALSSLVFCPKCRDIYRRINGITGERSQQYGDAAAESKADRQHVMQNNSGRRTADGNGESIHPFIFQTGEYVENIERKC